MSANSQMRTGHRFEDDKIAQTRTVEDNLERLTQLGLSPPQPDNRERHE